jgi:hypothetical protein
VAQKVGYFSNFQVTGQCKQSRIMRKFDQSGHSEAGLPDFSWYNIGTKTGDFVPN